LDTAVTTKTPIPVDSPWLTISDAAHHLRVTPLCIRNMIADGRLTAHSCGYRIVRLHIADIDAAMGRTP
jgi:excisionase family DNA binding protein